MRCNPPAHQLNNHMLVKSNRGEEELKTMKKERKEKKEGGAQMNREQDGTN